MFGLPLSTVTIAISLLFVAWQPIVVAEERAERIQAGKKFLTASRIDEWEKLFTQGVQKMGRIVVEKDGKVATEAWFENKHKLSRIFDTKNRVTTSIANPDYSAQVRTRDEESRIAGVGPTLDAGGCLSTSCHSWLVHRRTLRIY